MLRVSDDLIAALGDDFVNALELVPLSVSRRREHSPRRMVDGRNRERSANEVNSRHTPTVRRCNDLVTPDALSLRVARWNERSIRCRKDRLSDTAHRWRPCHTKNVTSKSNRIIPIRLELRYCRRPRFRLAQDRGRRFRVPELRVML